jgi:hypothetical protein
MKGSVKPKETEEQIGTSTPQPPRRLVPAVDLNQVPRYNVKAFGANDQVLLSVTGVRAYTKQQAIDTVHNGLLFEATKED